MREHGNEPIPGLPGRLPAGEHLLWQGAPDWRGLARRVFHLREIAAYFGIVALWMAASTLYDGGGVAKAAAAAGVTLLIGAVPMALFALYAYAIEKTTVYTITSRRVVLRAGVALPVAINLPFASIAAAAAQARADGSGDIALTLAGPGGPGYGVLWPHARPWRFRKAEPLLRALAEIATPARILTDALDAARAETPPLAVAAE